MNVEKRIWPILARHTVAPLPEAEARSVDLLAEGYLDSLGIVALTFELQDEFGVKFKIEELVPRNFQSIGAIADLAQRALAQNHPQEAQAE